MKPVDRLPENVRRLLRRIGRIGEDAGVRTYAVGGFVRDLILGVPNLDLDVTVEGDGRRFAEVLARKMGGDVISYDRFGTATLSLGEGPIERMDVVTARRERYPHPGALPEVEPATIREDLFRRDFTINAMAMALNPNRFGQIVDFYGGLRDLRGKIIRVMHDMSFIDDPTRLFRCVRFEARYDFTVEPHTSSLFRRAIDEGMPLRVSRQRIWHEMKLILAEDLPEKPIRRMSEVGLLRFISPDLEVSDETIRLFGGIRGALDL
ncbi:TPA: CCA tRNA nucleotidyltransferase, partial [Candidatus Poribacteria bacterium]|nr:CCA tRNA nucleotidyltransferase [Candidatus Poribacteria bacterium]